MSGPDYLTPLRPSDAGNRLPPVPNAPLRCKRRLAVAFADHVDAERLSKRNDPITFAAKQQTPSPEVLQPSSSPDAMTDVGDDKENSGPAKAEGDQKHGAAAAAAAIPFDVSAEVERRFKEIQSLRSERDEASSELQEEGSIDDETLPELTARINVRELSARIEQLEGQLIAFKRKHGLL